MPVYLDSYIVPDRTDAETCAKIHLEYIKIQEGYKCKCLMYWLDEKSSTIFFIIDALDKNAIKKMNNTFNTLTHHQVIQVNENLIANFINEIQTTNSLNKLTDSDLKTYSDPEFRVILITKITNTRLLQHIFGIHETYQLLLSYEKIVSELLLKYNGQFIESESEGYIAYFTTASNALECAMKIQNELKETGEYINLRMGIHAGGPDSKINLTYDNIIKLANYLSGLGKKNQIVISSIVHELCTGDGDKKIDGDPDLLRWLFPCHGEFLELFMDTLVNNWQNSKFGIHDICNHMSMSKSKLYRKCLEVIGIPANNLIRDFRLEKSLEILNKTDKNINQTAFETGFNSASYFNKCFKNKFNILPTSFLKNSVAT